MSNAGATDQLNQEQCEAVNHTGSPLIVLAGPGTGKTRVIIARVLRLLESGAPPESILAVTFSVKATNEMRERLAQAAKPSGADLVRVSTFHSFGAAIVSRFGDWIGTAPRLVLMDSARYTRIIRSIIRAHDLYRPLISHGRDSIIGEARRFIAACKNAARSPAEAVEYAERRVARARSGDCGLTGDALEAERAVAELMTHHAKLYELVERECFDLGDVTFDDYLSLPLRIFTEEPAAAAIVRSETRHIVVDEFQDVNAAQIALLRHLAPPVGDDGRAPDLCVVGDDDQAIYGFRGSDPRAFGRFASTWPRHREVRLQRNYRSAPEIIAVSNAAIQPAERFAPDKELVAAGSASGSVEGVIVSDDSQTGSLIAAMIYADREHNPGKPWSDYAVIARTNSFRDEIAAELMVQGVPIDLRIPESPADDDAVKDLLSWLRLCSSSRATHDVHRLLVRPIGGEQPRVVLQWKERYEEHLGLVEDPAEAPGFLEWLQSAVPGNAGVASIARMLDDFRKADAEEACDRLVEQIIREARLAAGDGFGTDLLDPRQRAKRVGRLAQVIGFVRSRQEFLDPPGNAAEFLRYYDDLDPAEQKFTAPGHEQIEGSPDDPAEPGVDAVRVLTAHKSKGLEFDTVFVARVRPQYGFPQSNRDDGVADLPADFLGADPGLHADEERRVFYVACTRAARRLVLIAKHKKSLKGATDYFIELTHDRPDLGVTQTPAEEWFERGEVAPPSSISEDTPMPGEPGRAWALRAAMARSRREAFAALQRAEQPEISGDSAADIREVLINASSELAALGALSRGKGDTPLDSLPPRVRALVEQLEAERGEALFAPMPPPLRLSFSAVTAYEQCPRCYYLQYVLGLNPPESEEQSFGTAAHQALRQFYSDRREAEADGQPLPGVERLISLATAYQRRMTRGRPDPEVLAQLVAQMRRLCEDLEDDAAELHQDLEATVRIPFQAGGHAHSLVAKIDRVDAMPDGSYRIVDYKTGKAFKRLLEPKPDDLQLGIYALALPELLKTDGVPPGTAEYWCLAAGRRGAIALDALKLDKVRAKITAAAEGMLAGNFEKKETCQGHCDFFGDHFAV